MRKTGGPARGRRRTDARVALVFDEGREKGNVDKVLSGGGDMEAERVTKEITREGPREKWREGESWGRGKRRICIIIFFLEGATKTGREDEAVESGREETRRQRNYGLLTEHAGLGQRGLAEDLNCSKH